MLNIEVERHESEVLIHVSGELTYRKVIPPEEIPPEKQYYAIFKKEILEIAENNCKKISLNLKKLSAFDSFGCVAIIHIQKNLSTKGIGLILIDAPNFMTDLMDETKLTPLFQFETSPQ